jgi:hypothetical protein
MGTADSGGETAKRRYDLTIRGPDNYIVHDYYFFPTRPVMRA